MKLSEEFLRIAQSEKFWKFLGEGSPELYGFLAVYMNRTNQEWLFVMSDDHARLFCCLMAEIVKEEE